MPEMLPGALSDGLFQESGHGGLGLCGTLHASIGLRGRICLARRSDLVIGRNEALREWHLISVGIYFIGFDIKLDEIGRSETRCKPNSA
jgi:hypothetical protein